MIDQVPDGYKKATKTETDAYFKWLNGEGGEIADGTKFDGEFVYVKDTKSSTSNTSKSDQDDK